MWELIKAFWGIFFIKWTVKQEIRKNKNGRTNKF